LALTTSEQLQVLLLLAGGYHVAAELPVWFSHSVMQVPAPPHTSSSATVYTYVKPSRWTHTDIVAGGNLPLPFNGGLVDLIVRGNQPDWFGKPRH
jgi:hypothetical protein